MDGEKKKKKVDQKAVRNRVGNEWNVIRSRVIGRWGFSWDLTQGLLKKSMVAIVPVNLRIRRRKEESSKISQKEVHFNSRHRLFQRFRNTPVFIGLLLPLYFSPSHCPLRNTCINMKIPIDFLLLSQQR